MTSVLSNSITAFTRAAASGALTQGTGPAGCIAALPAAGCGLGRGFAQPEGLAVSPDERSVYVASFKGALNVLARDPGTGVVTQLTGRQDKDGCIAAKRTRGCATGRGLAGVSSVAVSPDGRFVYTGATGADAIAVFQRDLVRG